ncbi:cytochrome b561 and DOMON domain-containing protein At2g04850-like, partial [Phalaenopsis equestris]|uniref:cytochrome b561 and DOMON domain-containing protein At2g04850-like n=1 Tax=Phalaenopsis equestris TaxID=78828 RepID=UPI0009E19F6C
YIPFLSPSASLIQSPSVRSGAIVRISASLHLSPNRTRINLIWNRGLYVQGYSPTVHPTTPIDLASRTTIDLLSASADISSKPLPTWFRSAHGSINAITWGFFIPAGAMAARYLRQWPGIGSGSTWFYIHAAVQISAVAVGSVGFGFGVAMGNRVYVLHRGLGFAVMTAGGLQAAAMFFRPATTHRYRKYWKSYHHLLGYGLVVVGVVNVFQGMEMMELGRSYAKLVYCLAVGTMGGACVALEANGWVLFCRKAEEEKVRREEGGERRRFPADVCGGDGGESAKGYMGV